MPHLTIYLSAEIEAKLRKAARRDKLSVSRWISKRVADSLADEWPKEFLALAGSCPDFPSLDEIRSGYGQDAPREAFDE
jgi:hypothetical protein